MAISSDQRELITRANLNADGARYQMLFQKTKRPPLDRYERLELNVKPSEQML